jgi:hypothetical protein
MSGKAGVIGCDSMNSLRCQMPRPPTVPMAEARRGGNDDGKAGMQYGKTCLSVYVYGFVGGLQVRLRR